MKDKSITPGDFRFIFRFLETWAALFAVALAAGAVGYLLG